MPAFHLSLGYSPDLINPLAGFPSFLAGTPLSRLTAIRTRVEGGHALKIAGSTKEPAEAPGMTVRGSLGIDEVSSAALGCHNNG